MSLIWPDRRQFLRSFVGCNFKKSYSHSLLPFRSVTSILCDFSWRHCCSPSALSCHINHHSTASPAQLMAASQRFDHISHLVAFSIRVRLSTLERCAHRLYACLYVFSLTTAEAQCLHPSWNSVTANAYYVQLHRLGSTVADLEHFVCWTFLQSSDL